MADEQPQNGEQQSPPPVVRAAAKNAPADPVPHASLRIVSPPFLDYFEVSFNDASYSVGTDPATFPADIAAKIRDAAAAQGITIEQED